MAAQLVQVVRRLGYRLGISTGLFKPTAAQTEAEVRAFLQSLKIDYNDIDGEAVRIYWRLKNKGQDLPLDDVTLCLKTMRDFINK
uniref:Uncharacterized protein n=1 Tax=Hordeum vulgare subsp. vulgare TaxID=112509 RepID=A0A8I6Y7B8_HORVV